MAACMRMAVFCVVVQCSLVGLCVVYQIIYHVTSVGTVPYICLQEARNTTDKMSGSPCDSN
jgi:hypothetical protein